MATPRKLHESTAILPLDPPETPKGPLKYMNPNVNVPFEATEAMREKVKFLCAIGYPPVIIAKLIDHPKTGWPIGEFTLRKHFANEIECGTAEINSRVANSLFLKAMGDGPQAVTAAIFWLKVRLRWHDTDHLAVSLRPVEQLSSDELHKLVIEHRRGEEDEAKNDNSAP